MCFDAPHFNFSADVLRVPALAKSQTKVWTFRDRLFYCKVYWLWYLALGRPRFSINHIHYTIIENIFTDTLKYFRLKIDEYKSKYLLIYSLAPRPRSLPKQNLTVYSSLFAPYLQLSTLSTRPPLMKCLQATVGICFQILSQLRLNEINKIGINY